MWENGLHFNFCIEPCMSFKWPKDLYAPIEKYECEKPLYVLKFLNLNNYSCDWVMLTYRLKSFMSSLSKW